MIFFRSLDLGLRDQKVPKRVFQHMNSIIEPCRTYLSTWSCTVGRVTSAPFAPSLLQLPRLCWYTWELIQVTEFLLLLFIFAALPNFWYIWEHVQVNKLLFLLIWLLLITSLYFGDGQNAPYYVTFLNGPVEFCTLSKKDPLNSMILKFLIVSKNTI